ncbi:MAG: hypothetical protein U0Z70_20470 [Thermomicrobiales bacterium]
MAIDAKEGRELGRLREVDGVMGMDGDVLYVRVQNMLFGVTRCTKSIGA